MKRSVQSSYPYADVFYYGLSNHPILYHDRNTVIATIYETDVRLQCTPHAKQRGPQSICKIAVSWQVGHNDSHPICSGGKEEGMGLSIFRLLLSLSLLPALAKGANISYILNGRLARVWPLKVSKCGHSSLLGHNFFALTIQSCQHAFIRILVKLLWFQNLE